MKLLKEIGGIYFLKLILKAKIDKIVFQKTTLDNYKYNASVSYSGTEEKNIVVDWLKIYLCR